jgi:hypothetical protein
MIAVPYGVMVISCKSAYNPCNAEIFAICSYLELYCNSRQQLDISSRGTRALANHKIISLTVSTNTIIAYPKGNHLLALILLDFEIISLTIDMILPDHSTGGIHDHDC